MREYELRRSERRTVSVEITASLGLLVRAPMRMSRAEIDAFVERSEGWIAKHTELRRARQQARPEPTPEEEAALRRLAAEYLPKRTAYYGQIMGLAPTAVKISSARTRFGSCSGKNSICYSWRLMRFPMEAVDYVVVHELAHIVHKNHGREFYGLIASILPDYRQREAVLKGGAT